ncbi:primosomal protein N' [Nonomuraea bangladeshensis]|uniref:primosomal protein N' n=1 Tax=Nonomuraea bangladeshensis TaxID=404385 RepID=UPI003C2AD657
MTDSDDALLPLDAVRPAASSKDTKGAVVPAPERPVARVAVDSPLPHLDRPFDYLVPAALHETAEPGVRVRVRFAGKLVDGFLLERVDESDHEGRLMPLERVVSPERVLTPEIAGLARAVADRYAGTFTDVLRLAIPPRHAKAESETPKPDRSTRPDVPDGTDVQGEAAGSVQDGEGAGAPGGAGTPGDAEAPRGAGAPGDSGGAGALGGAGTSGYLGDGGAAGGVRGGESAWDAYPMGPSFLDALRHGRAPRAVWSALPGALGWARPMAEAVRATLDGGRGAVVVVPDGKDVALADAELARVLGPGRHVALTADLGPAERYRRWLKVLRGQVRAVVGTRAAMFAPVAELGLVAIWDDGDDLHAERLAPYPHAREVLGLRAHRTGAAMLIGGYARTAEATQLIAGRWARPIVAARTTIRSLAPRVRPAGEDAELAKDQAARQARLPSLAWRALRHGLDGGGPVLVQVPRRGYLPALACRNCRTPARCVLPPTRTLLAPPGADAPPVVPLSGPSSGFSGGGGEAGGSSRGRAGGGQDLGRLPGGPSRVSSGLAAGGQEVRHLPGGTSRVSAGLAGDGQEARHFPDGSSRMSPGPTGGGQEVLHLPGGLSRSQADPARVGEVSGDPGRQGPPGSDDQPRHGVGEGVSAALPLEPAGTPAASCHGPLALRGGHAAPYCRWCGRVDAAWRCPSCGSPHLRAVVIGARRTAEELGRAFPSIPVRTSGRDGVLATVPASRALVVATPGAEPVAEGGYAAAVLLDGWALLGRADLRAGEEAVRRWMNAAALLRPGAELVVLADAALPAVQALVRWDPITHAERELADRAELGFPPAVRMATLTGPAAAVRQMIDEAHLPAEAQVLGPVPVDDEGQERAMIRVRRTGGAALAAALKGASGVRAARKTPDVVRVSVDPLDLI